MSELIRLSEMMTERNKIGSVEVKFPNQIQVDNIRYRSNGEYNERKIRETNWI